MRATMDLIAIYDYDNTVLDLMQLPEEIDRQTLIDNLLMETAEREIIYSNIGFLKQAIGSWSSKNISVWKELYKTQHYDYNPIWNKDGKIVETHNLQGTDYRTDNLEDKTTHNDTLTRTHNDTLTRTHNDTIETTFHNGNTSVHSVYGFNATTAAEADKDRVDYDGTTTDKHTGTTSDGHSGTIADAHTGTITDGHTGTLKHDTSDTGTITRTEQGNIGLTSTQDLIKQQQELVKFNLMDYIIDDFSKKFCLAIY